MSKLYNKRHGNAPVGAVYIGRPSKWGNPFRIGPDGTREQVIAKHKRMWEIASWDKTEMLIQELRGKDLVCWCAPLPCHGDVLLEIANAGVEEGVGRCLMYWDSMQEPLFVASPAVDYLCGWIKAETAHVLAISCSWLHCRGLCWSLHHGYNWHMALI